MYIWNDIARRYFGLEGFPIGLGLAASGIWNADSTYPLTLTEKIVLRSTMDRMVIKTAFVEPLYDAFMIYGTAHPDSSFSEQAQLIKQWFGDDKSDERFIAWNQTSVSEFWGHTWDDEHEEFYDPRVNTDHWEVLISKP